MKAAGEGLNTRHKDTSTLLCSCIRQREGEGGKIKIKMTGGENAVAGIWNAGK
jgi:hypothetical protein